MPISATEEKSYSELLGALDDIGAKVNKIRNEASSGGEDAVVPDVYAYDAAALDAYGQMRFSVGEWQPDVRSICRREAKRRRMDELDCDTGCVVQISVDAIRPNRSQPRSHFETNSVIRLADSIRRYGILQPLSVRVISATSSNDRAMSNGGSAATYGNLSNDAYHGGISAEKAENNAQKRLKFEIIAGERRFRAAKMLGMESVPCMIVSADDKRSAELSLIENLLREDLDIFETARAIRKLIETFHMTQEEVAKRLSMSQSAVANKLRLLRFTAEEEKAILGNHLTERHARALLRLDDPTRRLEVIGVILTRRLNVSATEAYVEKLISEPRDESAPAETRKIPIIKDIRLFYNSLDRAVELVRGAGIDIESRRREDEGGVTIEIKIPHPRKCFT